MDKKTRRDVLWHAGKALLCALQLYILDRVTDLSVGIFLSYLLGEGIVLSADSIPFLFIRPAVTVALFFAIFLRRVIRNIRACAQLVVKYP